MAIFRPVPLRCGHFFPNAAFLLPIVKRFAVDLVNGRFRNGQLPGLYHHKEINIVNFAVSAFHVDTGEVFIAAKTRKPVIVDSDQVQRQIFTLIWHVKLLVGGFRGVAADEPLESVRNVRHARLHHRSLRSAFCCLRQLLRLGLLRGPWMFLGTDRQDQDEKRRYKSGANKSCIHRIFSFLTLRSHPWYAQFCFDIAIEDGPQSKRMSPSVIGSSLRRSRA